MKSISEDVNSCIRESAVPPIGMFIDALIGTCSETKSDTQRTSTKDLDIVSLPIGRMEAVPGY